MIIDADGHFAPKLTLTGIAQVDDWISAYNERKKNSFSDPLFRQTELQTLGVDLQLLNPMGVSQQLFYNINTSIASKVMQNYNDAMSQVVENCDCFDMNLWLALQDFDSSLEEIERFLDRKFFGLHVSECPHWGFLEHMHPMWQKIETHGIPWYIHLTTSDDDLAPGPCIPDKFLDLKNHWRNDPWKFTIASFILGHTIDRYPNLKIVIAERDIDWIKQFCHDMIEFIGVDPLPYLKQNFWFTIEPEQSNFLSDAKFIGFDRLLFATDWPHDKDIGGKNALFDAYTVNNLKITDNDLSMICQDNYKKLQRQIKI